MNATVVLENGKKVDIILTKEQIDIVNMINKPKDEPEKISLDKQIDIAFDKLISNGYKQCFIDFSQGIITAGIDFRYCNFEEYLDRYKIPRTSKFYYTEFKGHYEVITYGLGLQGIDNSYGNGSAYIDRKFIIDK